jgi:hypothetical protein
MKITLNYKSAWGNQRYYPACDDSEVIAYLAGFKSFTTQQVEYMKKRGWTVDILAELPK